MWPEWLNSIVQDQAIVVVAVVFLLVLAVGIVSGQWRRVRLAQIEASLKQQMLDKGVPIADMERVLRASTEASEEETTAQLTGDAAVDQPRLVRKLLEHSYSGDDVERLLRALRFPQDDAQGCNSSQQRAQVLAILVENGLEADEIERILLALDDTHRVTS